jgi:crotonobetainyl-CoA:carnitine CoA-transferase CaiB-like acyl-CoA transferase
MLGDVTVAEIGDSLSVAYCGRLLADAGARVLRFDTGELSPLASEDPDYAAYLHHGKEQASHAAGIRQALAGAAGQVDVAVCDSKAAFEVLGSLRAEHPGLIIVCVSDYGLTGLDAATQATELTLQTEAGLAVMHVSPSSPPFVCGLPLSQLSGGIYAAIGAMQGLLARDCGGEHLDVDVSRFESLVSLLTFPWNWRAVAGHVPYSVPIDGHAPLIPPMNTVPEIVRAKDGWACLAANVPAQWESLKRMTGVTGLDDPRFDQVSTRATYMDEIVPLVESFTTRHTVEELIDLGQRHRVPVAPVLTPASAYQLPPYSERGSSVTGVAGDFRQPRPAFRFTMGAPDGAPRTTRDSGSPAHPLRGVRVVGFELFHAGPLVTRYLAGLGAEVVKIEAVNRPDLIRFAGIPNTADRFWERSATFIALNIGKRSITADLTTPAGIDIVRKLLSTADVVLDCFVPRTLDSRGLDYDGVRQIRPDIVMTRMPGWGLAGSWADRPAYTEIVESASGTASLTGTDDGAPHRTGTVFDPMSSSLAIFATLAAIRHRRVTGEGSQVEVALCDSTLQFTAQAMIRASSGRRAAPRHGNRSATMAPQGIYQCGGDDWIGFTIQDNERWSALRDLPGTQWAADDRFATVSGRIRHHDELDELIGRWTAGFPAAGLAAALRGAGIAAAPLTIGPELIDHPQIRERGRVFTAPHPVAGTMSFIGSPVRMSTLPVLPDSSPAPTLGGDNGHVLAGLGYSEAWIAELLETGAIGSIPYAKPKHFTPGR